MTTRLALTSAPVSIADRYGKFSGAASTQPSFGLACLAATAIQAGTETCIVEAAAQDLSIEQTLKEIMDFRPNIAGISATTVGISAAWELSNRIKKISPDTLIIIGGPHVSALPQESLRECASVDITVIGEGERTLEDILRRFPEGHPALHGILGTAERRNIDIVVNEPRSLISDLDDLPLPAWSLLKGFPCAFRPSPARIKRWPCASVVFTRGCPNKCTFCDRSVFGQHCRAYSPAHAVEIVKDLKNNYGVNEILIEDDTFIISKKRVEEFCRRIIEDNIQISWSCLGRADRVDLDLLKLMHKAGCWHISYGIESGDPEILKTVNKNLNIEQITNALKWSREAGLRTKGFFMVGFPGETPQSIEKTICLVRHLPMDDISVMQLTPFPGTELYAVAKKYGTFNPDWQKMNALNTVFVPSGFTTDQLNEARQRIFKAFYLQPKVLFRHAIHLLLSPSLIIHAMSALSTFFKVIIFGKAKDDSSA